MNRKSRKGFTLIEVMLVAAILVLLAAGGVVAYTRYQATAKRDMATTRVSEVTNAIKMYQVKMDRLPTTEEGLKALLEAPADEKLAEKWKNAGGPFIEKMPTDPWDNELKYELLQTDSSTTVTGPAFRVWSMGPDGVDGTADDIPPRTDSTSTGG